MKKLLIITLAFLAIAAGCFFVYINFPTPHPLINDALDRDIRQNEQNNNTTSSPDGNISVFTPPINNWQSRVTKKPFGIFITPKDSPVQPEKFTGYHTGVDFETFENEQDVDVSIYAICDGPLLSKRIASGYGGVAVQACKLDDDITVVYGHLRLASITAKTGEQFSIGQQIGLLGTGFSAETDGERKHLHLGIHKGNAINILGYVQIQSQLNNWLDVTEYLK